MTRAVAAPVVLTVLTRAPVAWLACLSFLGVGLAVYWAVEFIVRTVTP